MFNIWIATQSYFSLSCCIYIYIYIYIFINWLICKGRWKFIWMRWLVWCIEILFIYRYQSRGYPRRVLLRIFKIIFLKEWNEIGLYFLCCWGIFIIIGIIALCLCCTPGNKEIRKDFYNRMKVYDDWIFHIFIFFHQ